MKFPKVHSVLNSDDTGRGFTVSNGLKPSAQSFCPEAVGFSSCSCWEDKLEESSTPTGSHWASLCF